MPINQRFLVVKNKDSKTITYMDYDKINGCEVKPKNNLNFVDAINVKSMVLINPSLIEKMVDMKARKRFSKLINILSIVYEESDDDASGDGLMLAKNEAEKFRMEIINKYKKYLSEEKLELYENKLAILEDELNLRLNYINDNKIEKEDTNHRSK